MNKEEKKLNSRINTLIVVAFVVFISAAKMLQPHEEVVHFWGTFGIVLLVIALALLSLGIETVISKIKSRLFE